MDNPADTQRPVFIKVGSTGELFQVSHVVNITPLGTSPNINSWIASLSNGKEVVLDKEAYLRLLNYILQDWLPPITEAR